jgi:hypothetical protein
VSKSPAASAAQRRGAIDLIQPVGARIPRPKFLEQHLNVDRFIGLLLTRMPIDSWALRRTIRAWNVLGDEKLTQGVGHKVISFLILGRASAWASRRWVDGREDVE